METNSRWKTSIDIFQGYTKAKLENIGDDIKEMSQLIRDFHKCVDGKIKTQDKKIHRMNGKVAAIAATVSAILSIVLVMLSKLIR